MNYAESAIEFDCRGDRLLGILTRPERLTGVGVVIVVGGPQYRIGSHRQFVLLARALASAGHLCLRFDHRGVGDSEGLPRSFEQLDEDIGAAIDSLFMAEKSLREVVLWGLCDAASAILLYCLARRDPRLSGVLLLNPWVRSEQTLAQARVRHYYLQRILDVNFWRKLLVGGINPRTAIRDWWQQWQCARSGGEVKSPVQFQEKMLASLRAFDGRVLILLSDQDTTAQEFAIFFASRLGDGYLEKNERRQLAWIADADHTFSSAKGRSSVEEKTLRWLAGSAS